jgi:polysaccharide export outer membrane protein
MIVRAAIAFAALIAASAFAQTSPLGSPIPEPPPTPVQAPPAPAQTSPTVAQDDGYRIGPEDQLEISVWKEEGLKKETVVRPDGAFSFPLIGDVQAAGRTVAEVRDEIGKRLARYIPEPTVSVLVLRVASNKIYVIGRVNKPGDFAVGRYIDVLQALALAGGLTPFADEHKIKVIRKQDGKDVVLPFDFAAVSRGEALEQNIRLQGGDVIVVP